MFKTVWAFFVSLFFVVAMPLYAQEKIEQIVGPANPPIVSSPDYVINHPGRSVTVQGLGNKILDVAESSRYWIVFSDPDDKRELAYSIKRLPLNSEIYTGSAVDIEGLIFFELTVYVDGFESYTQVTAFMQSEYSGAIKFDKWSRDEQHNYLFNMTVDKDNHLMIIDSPSNTYSLTPSDTIMKSISIKERNKKYVF